MAKNHICDNGTRIVLLRLMCFNPGNPIPVIHKNLVVIKVLQCLKYNIYLFILFILYFLYLLRKGFL